MMFGWSLGELQLFVDFCIKLGELGGSG